MPNSWKSSKLSQAPGFGGLRRQLTVRFAALLSLFVILIVISYLATSAVIKGRVFEGAILNRAGMQRMLVERYSGQVNRVMVGMAVGDWDIVLTHKQLAAQTAEQFIGAHRAFLDGGTLALANGGEATIPAISDDEIRRELRRVGESWKELCRSATMALRSDRWSLKDNKFVERLQAQTEATVNQMNVVARLMQRESEGNLRRLNTLQVISLVSGIILFAGILWFVDRQIVIPLNRSFTQREQSQRETQLILDSVGEGIYGVNAQGEIYFANACAAQLLGRDVNELNGALQHELVHGGQDGKASHGVHRCPIDAARTSGERFILQEDVFSRADGILFDVEYSSTPIVHGDANAGCVVAFRDVTQRKAMERSLTEANRKMVQSSRLAGMAEVAIGVLHNAGNVLNSVNVSAELCHDILQNSRSKDLARAVALINEHQHELAAFMSSDAKGKMLPAFLEHLSRAIQKERGTMLEEFQRMRSNVQHLKAVIQSQQSSARCSGVAEELSLVDVVEEAITINETSLHRHNILIHREFLVSARITTDRHKVLQILINLLHNAKQAVAESKQSEQRITVRVEQVDCQFIHIRVEDTGVGIPAENVTRIFAHGFTTKKDGHGFGLHSCACTAIELGGSLSVHSDGIGRGAAFTLTLPYDNADLLRQDGLAPLEMTSPTVPTCSFAKA